MLAGDEKIVSWLAFDVTTDAYHSEHSGFDTFYKRQKLVQTYFESNVTMLPCPYTAVDAPSERSHLLADVG